MERILEAARDNYILQKLKAKIKPFNNTSQSVKALPSKVMTFNAALRTNAFQIMVPIKELKPKVIKTKTKSLPPTTTTRKTTTDFYNTEELLKLRNKLYKFKKNRLDREKERFNKKVENQNEFLFEIDDLKKKVKESAFKTDYEKEADLYATKQEKFKQKVKKRRVFSLITDNFTFLNDFKADKTIFNGKPTNLLKKVMKEGGLTSKFRYTADDFSPAFKKHVTDKFSVLQQSSKRLSLPKTKGINEDLIFIREEPEKQLLEYGIGKRRSSVMSIKEVEDIPLKAANFIKNVNNHFGRVKQMLKKEEQGGLLKRLASKQSAARKRHQKKN